MEANEIDLFFSRSPARFHEARESATWENPTWRCWAGQVGDIDRYIDVLYFFSPRSAARRQGVLWLDSIWSCNTMPGDIVIIVSKDTCCFEVASS
jgi:hypothetical protein